MFIHSPALTTGVTRERTLGAGLRALLARPRSLRAHMAIIILIALAAPLAVQLLSGVALLNSIDRRLSAGIQNSAETLALVVSAELDAVTKALAPRLVALGAETPQGLPSRAKALASAEGADVLVWRRDGTIAAWAQAQAQAQAHAQEQAGAGYGTPGDAAAPAAMPAALAAAIGRDARHVARARTGRPAVLVSQAGVRPTLSVFVAASGDYVLEAIYPTERLVPLLTLRPRWPEVNATCLVDETGAVIAGQAATPCETGTVLPEWLRGAIARDRSGLADAAQSGGVAFAAFATPAAAPDWRVLIFEPNAPYSLTLQGPAAATIGVAALSVALAVLTAMAAGALLSRSLRSLTLAAQGVAAGADSLGEVAASPVAEFNDLRVSVARADAVLRRRAAAERLALREARTGHELLASVVNATADLIYVKDLNLRFVLANRAALVADWVDRDEWQVLGRRESDIIEPEKAARLEALDREVLASGDLRSGRIEWPHADGSWHLYAMTKTPWRDAGGAIAGVVTVVHDITDQRAAEQRLAGVQGELLRATRLSAMGEMASGLAHELNQPLAAATNFLNATVHLLGRDDPSGSLPLVRAAVTDAAEQTLRAGAIVRRLRDFVGRGESDLNVENVGEIVSEIRRVACADGAIDDRELVVEPGGASVIALVERTQIQQVLLNLIKNASEAIGGRPGGRITLSWHASVGAVEIVVADNGPGLSPDIRGRLFQPFTSTKTFGMGIGLAICRTIVEGHGGRLAAEDNPGGGALFRVTLPPATSDAFDTSEQQS